MESQEPPGQDYARGAAERQRRGDVVFLVAELDGSIVGSAELTVAGRAELKNLFVPESARGYGVGTALIHAAEQVVDDRVSHGEPGPRVLVLGVGIDNPRAAALYERLGYVRSGVITTTTYDYVDDRGTSRTVTETDEDLIKHW